MKIITQLDIPGLNDRIRAIAPEAEVVHLPLDAQVPDDLSADALLTVAFGNANLEPLLSGRHGIRWVHVFGTGVDNFPTGLIGDRLFSCSRGASAIPIAEWTLAMMLSAVKQIPHSWIDRPPQQWHTTFQLQPLCARRLAILGFGAIGRAVAERAAPFGMHIRTQVRRPRPLPVAGVEQVETLEALLEDADHVVLAAPATPATRHIIGDAALAAMKPGAHLINIARGSLIDEDALKRALDAGHLGCASLDAVEPEPLPAGHWMYSHPRVRLSPHISWSDPGTFDRLLDGFLTDLDNYVRGRPLQGAVDIAEGY